MTPQTLDGIFAGRERMSGIEHVLRRAGVGAAGVIECAWEVENGYDEVRALLTGGHRPQVIIGCNDRVSFGACQALQEAGLDVPGDVSVVSFDDSELASWMRPQLTSIALPHYQLGRTAVELLIAGHLEAVEHRIPMPLRMRASLATRTHH
ncbi:substrate-binding domain-containing protein [Streptomyces sp. TRM49041]|uniref:substrate-binding domain-containing protein n=1 Tax=Streptomyces sp. TRM49041 TaxID=2603216 RepID=UPI0021CD107E|nr:substrate-binding domain-containing protein [Streptomyces sp. TRM49041]